MRVVATLNAGLPLAAWLSACGHHFPRSDGRGLEGSAGPGTAAGGGAGQAPSSGAGGTSAAGGAGSGARANGGASGEAGSDAITAPSDFPACGELDPSKDCSGLANLRLDAATVVPEIPAGTTERVIPFDVVGLSEEKVTFTFWLGLSGTRCVGPSIDVPITIAPRPGL